MINRWMQPLVILGAGGHGRVVLDAAQAGGVSVRGFLDSTRPPGSLVNGILVLGPTDLLEDSALLAGSGIIVALGDQEARRRFSLHVLDRGGTLATVCHPAAVVSAFATLGCGSFLAAGSIVAPNAAVGRFCLLNTACSVDHDARLGDGVQVCPGARLAGRVVCGEGSFIGTGAAIIPDIIIGRHAAVGAGAVVIRDVPPGETVAGNPAHPIAPNSGLTRP